MKGKMYKLTGTGLFGKPPRGQFTRAKQPIPTKEPGRKKPNTRKKPDPGIVLPATDKSSI